MYLFDLQDGATIKRYNLGHKFLFFWTHVVLNTCYSGSKSKFFKNIKVTEVTVRGHEIWTMRKIRVAATIIRKRVRDSNN